MQKNFKIILIYAGTALLSAAILWIAFWVRSGLIEREKPYIVNPGADNPSTMFAIAEDLEATNQSGDAVKLSDLKGKVWVVGEFFAVCPHCAMRNGQELRALLNEFGAHQDFHLTCVSIDPETDNVEKLKDYASALNADPKNWWFLTTADNVKAHAYMENTMKFFKIKMRTDPADIESNGKFAHDLGLALVNKNFEVVGKWPLADARKTDPVLYESLKRDMYEKIRQELAKL
jgi:cytochrome oxidase Cu insertion factor (SCO1/SenC/PrrC family)